MKKLLLLFCTTLALNVCGQELSQQKLLENIKNQIKYDNMSNAFVGISTYNNNFPKNDESRYLNLAAIYYAWYGEFQNKDIEIMKLISKQFANELEYFKGKPDYYSKVLYMSTLFDFTFIYYYGLKSKLESSEVSKIKGTVLERALEIKGNGLQTKSEIQEIIDFIESD